MQKLILLVVLFGMTTLFAIGEYVGVAKVVKGSVLVRENKQDRVLIEGEKIYTGMIIKAGKNSKTFIKFNNDTYKMIESGEYLIRKSVVDLYKKTDESINTDIVMGTKAAMVKEEIIKDEEYLLESMEKDFKAGDYDKTVEKIEQLQKIMEKPGIVYMSAISFFKLGDEKESIRMFQKLLDMKDEKYNDLAHKGLVLNYIRLGDLKKAKEAKNKIKDSEMAKALETLF